MNFSYTYQHYFNELPEKMDFIIFDIVDNDNNVSDIELIIDKDNKLESIEYKGQNEIIKYALPTQEDVILKNINMT